MWNTHFTLQFFLASSYELHTYLTVIVTIIYMHLHHAKIDLNMKLINSMKHYIIFLIHRVHAQQFNS